MTLDDILIKARPMNKIAKLRCHQKIGKNRTLVCKIIPKENWEYSIYEETGHSPDSYGAIPIWGVLIDDSILTFVITVTKSMQFAKYIDNDWLDVKYLTR